MALTDKTPASWLGAGYSAQPGKIQLNISSSSDPLLKELGDSDANETSGDVRKVIAALLEGLYTKVAQKGASLGSLPNLEFIRSISVDQNTGVITRVYNVKLNLEATEVKLAPEIALPTKIAPTPAKTTPAANESPAKEALVKTK
jgi:hypothetical protein